MTCEPPRPAPPAPEAVAQALDLLLKAMEESKPASSEEGLAIESSITHLDRLALRHQVAGEALQLAAQTRAALFRRRRNAFIPFNRLPSEVLSAILIKAVDETQPRRIKALQMLAQVAWQWWQTIKSDPQFWADIMPPMEDAELQIRKAGIIPLRLYWQFSVGDNDYEAFNDLLQRHTGRWTGIDLRDSPGTIDLQPLCTSHFPRLKYIRVGSIPRIGAGVWRLNIEQCPNLEEAHLPITPYSLSSSSPTPLRILHLDLDRNHLHVSSDIESLLRLTPQLIDLEVKNLYDDRSPPSSHNAPIIDLPMLRRLKVVNALSRDDCDWTPLLAQIRSPQLEELGLHYDFDTDRWFDGMSRGFQCIGGMAGPVIEPTKGCPPHSVLRNAGPSASWRVGLSERRIRIKAMGTGNGRLDISMEIGDSSMNDDLPGYILPPPSIFPLPVDLHVIWWDETQGPEFWDAVLDATPSLRSVILTSRLDIAQRVMDRLSTTASSPSSTGPRAPFLEKLRFDPEGADLVTWSEGDEEEAVKTMLDRRRNIFIQGGVLDPPNLAVTGPTGGIFDEAEGLWLDFESSDARRGSEAVPEEELTWAV